MANGQPTLPTERRWIGGANLPTKGGLRVNATIPLAELVVAADSVSLRFRGPLSKLTTAEVLVTTPSDIDSVYPISPKGALGYRGVGFRHSNGHDYYFKTSKADEILSVMREYGFQVSSQAQPANKVWRATP
jgi:hypothetical protein